MDQTQLDRLFNRLEPAEVPPRLLERILGQISREAVLSSQRRRALLLIVTTVVMGTALILSGVAAGRDLYRAGFFDYAVLVFSEPAAVASAWKEYLMSLVESLPRWSLLVPLAIAFAYLELIKIIAGRPCLLVSGRLNRSTV